MPTFSESVIRVLAVAMLTLGVWVGAANGADVPLGTAFTYQGHLRDQGVEADGNYDFNFSLWDSEVGGLQVGGPLAAAAVPVAEGVFTVQLDFGFGVFAGAERWLEIEVRPSGGGAFTPLAPRQLLTAAPYAQALRLPFYGTQAQNGASFAITNPHGSGTAGRFHVTHASNSFQAVIGINEGPGAGVRGESNGSGAGVWGSGFYGLRGTTPTNSGYAVYGVNNNGNYGYIGDDDRAMYAYNAISGYRAEIADDQNALRATTGPSYSRSGAGIIGSSDTNIGVFGTSNSQLGVFGYIPDNVIYLYYDSGAGGYSRDGYGVSAVSYNSTAVYGWNFATSNNGRLGTPNYGVFGLSEVNDGIRGRTDSTDANVAGVRGIVQSTSPGSYSAGVRGVNNGTSGLGIGVYGTHEGSGWGVLGESPNGVGVYGSSISGYAGYFGGNVTVTGSLAKGGGSFKIDHPLDPENMYLYHSFVESPDMMNIYNGNVVTDDEGLAWVELPDWFEALNRDFRYQLTVIGEFAQAIVAEKMLDSRFRIATDRPNVEVSWQVTGIRRDAWANANRIPVEQAKSVAERGKFLHPAAFGEPASRGIDFREAGLAGSRLPETEPAVAPAVESVQLAESAD